MLYLLLLTDLILIEISDQHDDFCGLWLLGVVSEISGQLVIHDACGLDVG